MSDHDPRGEVIPLGKDPVPEPPPPATRPGRLHGFAIAGMAACALGGIIAMFLFVAVGWPDDLGRYVLTVAFLMGVGFIAFAAAAVFSAARDTYAKHPRSQR